MFPRKSKTWGRRSNVKAGAAAQGIQSSYQTVVVILLFLGLVATTLTLNHHFNVILHPGPIVKRLPYAATHILPFSRSAIQEERLHLMQRSLGLLSVRDIVAFPDEVMLLVEADQGATLPRRQNLECLFGENHTTGVLTIEWKDDLRSTVAVRCQHPSEPLVESKQATAILTHSNFILPSTAQYVTNSSWKPLVYETVTLADSVLLFVKGLVNSHGRPHNYSRSLNKLECSFGSDINGSTRVLGIAQEIVRCELPSNSVSRRMEGAPVSLFVDKIGVLPSVAYFNIPSGHQITRPSTQTKMFRICSCTMLWNQAQFLREWIMYHGLLGIERWFLYDNNSDDEIEEVLAGLLEYNVSRHAWPWIKTQEAGFSHCALRARAVCEWVLFTDVDEFVYPGKDLQFLVSRAQRAYTEMEFKEKNAKWDHLLALQRLAESFKKSNQTVLRKLIQRTVKKGEALGKRVGEVRLLCHNFGPSGQVSAPKEGVMLGYTCRMQWTQRHKSFVLLDAMSDSMMNVVHHFALREGYDQMAVQIRNGVINHYKFQAWEVFKAKFVRRVATYVVDWKEQTANSNDRAPGLGLEAVEPPNWPDKYCEELDLGLRNFTWNVFRHPQTQRMPWQLT